MIGPVANSVCIVAGSILGALCGPVLSQEFRKKIMNVFSCITLGIGVYLPFVMSSGAAIGAAVRIIFDRLHKDDAPEVVAARAATSWLRQHLPQVEGTPQA